MTHCHFDFDHFLKAKTISGFTFHDVGTVRHAPISALPCLSEANIGSCFETDYKIQNESYDKKTNGFNSKDIINTGQNAYTT